MNAELTKLAFRRTLPPGVVLFALAALLVAGTASWAPTAGALEELIDEELARALTRQGVWVAALVLLIPVLVFRAAASVAGWRRGEVDWMASSPTARHTLLLSTWAGTVAAGALVVGACGIVAEVAAGSGAETVRLKERTNVPRVVLVEEDALEHWTVNAPRVGEARLRVYLVAGGPGAEVRLALERDGGGRSEVTRRIAGRTELRAALPDGEGPVRVSLGRVGAGAIVALDPRGLDLLVPARHEWLASSQLFVGTWLALCAWLALALGFGAWVSGPIAATAVVAVTALTWSRATPGLPWSGLPEALALVGERIVPPTRPPAAEALTLLVIATGLLLGRVGLRSWRREG